MRSRKLIKRWVFKEEKRAALTLGTNVRLNPDGYLQLTADANGAYPTTADLYARTWLANPKSAKGWTLFQSEHDNAKVDNVEVTAVKFRISTDGVSDLYWDGAAWSAAGAGDWNTEAEVAANLAALPATQSLQVVINLSTSNAAYTPKVYAVKALYLSDIDFQEDYLARSLVPELRNVNPIAEFAVATAASTSTVDLSAMEANYNIVGIDSVYDLTNDPNKLNDLFQSYDAGAKVVTVASAVPAGATVLVNFTYSPEVVLSMGGEDYTELAKYPVIVIDSLDQSWRREIPKGEAIFDKTTGAGWQLRGYAETLNFTLRCITASEKDLQRLSGELKRWFANRTVLTSRGQDEDFRLQLITPYTDGNFPNQGGVHTGRLRARLLDAVFYLPDAAAVTATLGFQATGGNLVF